METFFLYENILCIAFVLALSVNSASLDVIMYT